MHKKICRYSLVVAFSVGCISGMQRDDILHELVRKDIISTLAVNDYLANVSTAYQGLLKETCFKQDMLHSMIKIANKALREKLANKGGIIYQLSDKKTVERVVNREIHYLRIPCFRYMEVMYKNGSRFGSIDDMEAHIKIFTFYYYISPIAFNSREYLCKERSFKNISTLAKNNIMRLLPQGKSAYIELYQPGRISDWIKVTNCCRPRDCAIQNQKHSLCKTYGFDYGYIGDPFEVDKRFCTVIFGITIMAVLLVGGAL